MNQQERQQIMNDFQQWVQRDFLPHDCPDESEHEGHLLRLMTMFSGWIFDNMDHELLPGRLLPNDTQAIVNAYGQWLNIILEQRAIEYQRGDPKDYAQSQHQYYHWPLVLFLASKHVAAEGN